MLNGAPWVSERHELGRFLRCFSHVGRAVFLKLHDRYRRARRAPLRRYPILNLDGIFLTVYGHQQKAEGSAYQERGTNLRGAPLTVRRLYNDRSRAEFIIRELKAAYSLNEIPMQDFGGTETFYQLVLLAYDLLPWSKPVVRAESLASHAAVVAAPTLRPGGESGVDVGGSGRERLPPAIY